ncbi:MAG TPA: hypothetical protein VIU12_28865 [Chryseolinea sp.]
MNKERIKDSILKRAAREWGNREIDPETSFDPVVSMILNAVAYELEKLYGEFNNTQKRVIERILDIIFPDTISGVIPARAIVHAEPLENNIQLSPGAHLFSCYKKRVNLYDPTAPVQKKITLGPTAAFVGHCAKVEFLAYATDLYRTENYFTKTPIAKAQRHIPPGTVWLGLKCQNNATDFQNLMFYIDIRNRTQKEYFFYCLQQARCFYGEREIPIQPGYNIALPTVDIHNIVRKNYSHLDQVCSVINEFFQPHFITLAGTVSLHDQGQSPAVLAHFKEDVFKGESNILWLRFVFPETLVAEIFSNVEISLNCFPFLNKEPYQTTGKALNPYFYTPLKTNDHFLDLDSVISSSGIAYHLKEYTHEMLEEGSATVRMAGVSRFDERDAMELLNYLLSLIKDEVGSFSGIGGDFMVESMRVINQQLASIHQNLKESNAITSHAPYLMLKKKGGDMNDGTLDIRHWGTCGEEANDVKPQTPLLSTADFLTGSTYLVTPTFGGVRQMNNSDKILMYRNAMLTRGRVVTVADIKAFTLNHFKASIRDVSVSKGTKKESSNKEGFSRTIDVRISRNNDDGHPVNETAWKYLCDSFLLNIKKVSSNVYPYRLMVDP